MNDAYNLIQARAAVMDFFMRTDQGKFWTSDRDIANAVRQPLERVQEALRFFEKRGRIEHEEYCAGLDLYRVLKRIDRT